jgi:LacI family transcriptional regulator
MIAPPLTTIRIRHREMGLQAARLLLDLVRKTSAGVVDIVLRPELMVRASTAAARQTSTAVQTSASPAPSVEAIPV